MRYIHAETVLLDDVTFAWPLLCIQQENSTWLEKHIQPDSL